MFLDREALEEKYSIRVDKNLLTSFDELRSIIQGQNTSDFEKLIGQKALCVMLWTNAKPVYPIRRTDFRHCCMDQPEQEKAALRQ